MCRAHGFKFVCVGRSEWASDLEYQEVKMVSNQVPDDAEETDERDRTQVEQTEQTAQVE